MRPRHFALLAMSALFAVLAACSTTVTANGAVPETRLPTASAAAPSQAAGLSATDWPTYHRDAARTGVAPATPAAGRLAIAWQRRLDGAVYGQPIVVGRTVVAATEGDSVYALDRTSGHVRWRVRLGTPVPLSTLCLLYTSDAADE